jgi:hypothetical protein
MDILSDIHDFFMGAPLAPYHVATDIRDIAEQIVMWVSRQGYRSPKARRLVSELLELADVVRSGEWSVGGRGMGMGMGRYGGNFGRRLPFRRSMRSLGWRNDWRDDPDF